MPRGSTLANASRPLRIDTYDGSGQCVHPDVIRVAGAFCDAELLMVVEPYPAARQEFENPSVLCSSDGIHWSVPAGMENPVVAEPDTAEAWNSDADFLEDSGRLLLYYRYNSGRGETTLFRKATEDGLRWTEAEKIFTIRPSGRFASPALVSIEGRVRLFFVDTLEQCVCVIQSTDGRSWDDARTLFHYPAAWHVDATVSAGTTYLMLTDNHSLVLLRSADLSAWSVLEGDEWRVLDPLRPASRPVLAPSAAGWDSALIYRATFLREEGLLRVWYSAKSRENEWRVGYTDGPLPE